MEREKNGKKIVSGLEMEFGRREVQGVLMLSRVSDGGGVKGKGEGEGKGGGGRRRRRGEGEEGGKLYFFLFFPRNNNKKIPTTREKKRQRCSGREEGQCERNKEHRWTYMSGVPYWKAMTPMANQAIIKTT